MNEKLNMQSLIDLLAEKRNMNKKDTELFVKEFFLLIEQTLENDKYLKIKGLGTFKLIDVESRESVNVNTGERFEIQGHTKISFVPEASLRDAINKPFSHFETVVLSDNTVLEDTLINSSEEDVDDNSTKFSDASEQSPEILISNTMEAEIAIPKKVESIMEIEKQVPLEEKTETEERKENLKQKEVNPVISSEGKHLSVEDIIALEIRKADAEYKEVSEKNTSSKITSFEKKTKKQSPVSYIISTAIAIAIVCVASVLYMYYPDLYNGLFSDDIQKASTTPDLDAKVNTIEVPVDTFINNVSNKRKLEINRDSIKEAVATLPQKDPLEGNKIPYNKVKTDHSSAKQAEPIIPDSVNYIIVGTKTIYTLQEGETLTKVSLRFYGTKKMWPYIVKHNRSTIKNPNKVPYGTVLKIPELKKK
ncbi:HU family DNA-binding protein [Bacteroides ihuae]|uniref:HU family DNA-binding protein n=1 Tax=Bacteroides ihuae TaxID=1852362 RepID=UPI0008D9AD94|nr:HU family DNA-binding protein [Bacteroides ihuae]